MRSKKKLIPIVIYTTCIFYITIFSRTPALAHTVRPIPLWSYIDWLHGNWSRGLSIALNIGLFIPLGYLLAMVWKNKWIPIITCLVLSAAIESTQYFAYLGYFDIDDIISNLLGGAVGLICYQYIGKKLENRKVAVSVVLILAGITGCLLTSGGGQIYETQFDFDIEHVNVENGRLSLSGTCEIYRRDPLSYQILLKGSEGTYKAQTDINGGSFKAVVDAPDAAYEVEVQFSGYSPISTSTFINRGEIEYVEPDTPAPDVENTDLETIVKNGTLKVYNAEYDTYVYQLGNRLYWLIGEDFTGNIIYHLHTDEPEKLPEERVYYGFDNRRIHVDGEQEITNKMECGQYRVFSDIIPTEYHITAIMVGLNNGPDIKWRTYFRINRFE